MYVPKKIKNKMLPNPFLSNLISGLNGPFKNYMTIQFPCSFTVFADQQFPPNSFHMTFFFIEHLMDSLIQIINKTRDTLKPVFFH